MSPTATRRYRIILLRWEAYDTVIDATSEADAIDQGEALHDAEGDAAFNYHDGGFDGIFAEAIDEEAGS